MQLCTWQHTQIRLTQTVFCLQVEPCVFAHVWSNTQQISRILVMCGPFDMLHTCTDNMHFLHGHTICYAYGFLNLVWRLSQNLFVLLHLIHACVAIYAQRQGMSHCQVQASFVHLMVRWWHIKFTSLFNAFWETNSIIDLLCIFTSHCVCLFNVSENVLEPITAVGVDMACTQLVTRAWAHSRDRGPINVIENMDTVTQLKRALRSLKWTWTL